MTSTGNALKLEIENYARSLIRSNALFLAAESGILTPQHMRTYVSGLLLLIHGTMRVLGRAELKADDLGETLLAEHYRRKRLEERGHHRWAESDLRGLAASGAEYPHDGSASGIDELVTYLEKVVDEDPYLFLSYILLAEYLTVLVGPAWLNALDHRCGVGPDNLTVVSKHVELDQEHVADGIREIDRLVTSPHKREPMLDVLRRCISCYERFWNEVLLTAPKAA